MEPRFFATPDELRAWLRAHHGGVAELWVGFRKKGSGQKSITWPEAVDEALCVGWIDGIRKSVDEQNYKIRFTPRRRGSTWSAVNIRRVEALTQAGRMLPAGLTAFAARREDRCAIYSYEQRPAELPEPYRAQLHEHRAAAEFFAAQPPGYRRTMNWWVVSAKQEATRQRRLQKLITESALGRRLR